MSKTKRRHGSPIGLKRVKQYKRVKPNLKNFEVWQLSS